MNVINDNDIIVSSSNDHISVSVKTGTMRISCIEANLILSRWQIARVLVQPSSLRRQGIGSALMQVMFKELKLRGADFVQVTPGGYNMKQEHQFSFYSKNGFTFVKSESDEDFLMEKKL